MPGSKKKPAAEPKAGNTLADKLARLGVAREQDLVLHLPLRYEDHTHLCPLAALKAGQAWQIEGTIAPGALLNHGGNEWVVDRTRLPTPLEVVPPAPLSRSRAAALTGWHVLPR